MQCLVCGSQNSSLFAKARDAEYFTLPDSFSYYHCQDCQNLFIDPLPKDKLSVIYPSNYYSFSAQDKSLLLSIKVFLDSLIFRKLLKNYNRPTLRALDVGGGEGWMLDVLAAANPAKLEGQIVDIDSKAQSLAEAKGYNYHCGTFENFSPAKPFDFILMLNLIEHVDNPHAMLTKAKQCLQAGGLLLLKTPNYDSLDARIFRHHNWGGFHCPRHWVLFTMDSLTRLAESVGFRVISKKYTQGSPFWTWSLLHWLHKRGLIELSSQKPAYLHPLCALFSLVFAAVDFARLPFSKTSQMIFVLQTPSKPS